MTQPTSYIKSVYEDYYTKETTSEIYSNIFYSTMEDLDDIFLHFGWVKYTDVSLPKTPEVGTQLWYRKTDLENNYYDFIISLFIENGDGNGGVNDNFGNGNGNRIIPYVQVSFPLKNSKYNVSVNITTLSYLGTFIIDKLHYFH